MNTAETFNTLFREAIPGLIKAIKAVPEDKLDWKPAEGSRPIRKIFTEAVMMPEYVAKAVTERCVPEYEPLAAEYEKLSISELFQRLPKNAESLNTAIAAFPESDYEQTLEAPWGTWTYFQTISYPYWNLMWHTGQINYIQSLYGDQNSY